MFKENRFVFGIDDGNAHSYLEGGADQMAYAEDADSAELDANFRLLEEFDNQAAVTPIDQGVGFTRYEVTTPGTLDSVKDLLEANAEQTGIGTNLTYRVFSPTGQEVYEGSFPEDFTTVLDTGFQVEVSRFANEATRDFSQVLSATELTSNTISYTVTQNTSLADLVENGLADWLDGNHLLNGNEGPNYRFRILGPDGRQLVRGSFNNLKGQIPARLASLQIPFGSRLETRAYDTTDAPVPTREESDALPPLEYTAEQFGNYADRALALGAMAQRLISREFSENPYNYDSQQITNMVRAYQLRNGLEPDGIIGPITRGKLEEQVAYFEVFDNVRTEMANAAQVAPDTPLPETYVAEEADAAPDTASEVPITSRGVLPFLTNPDGTPRTNIFGDLPERSIDVSEQATLDSSAPRIPSRQEMQAAMDEDSLGIVDRISDNLSEGPTG